jgi:DNA-binding CsgD family transcriptional regulator
VSGAVSGGEGLTARQRLVLVQLCAGLDEAEIAARLGLGRQTVHRHLKRIYEALRVRRKVHAIGHALRLRLVTAEDLVAAAEAASAAYWD